MEFKYGDVTIRCINPEALPAAKNNLAKLIIKLAEMQVEEDIKSKLRERKVLK